MSKVRGITRIALILLLSSISSSLRAQSLPPWAGEVTQLIQNGGVYVEGQDGKPLFDYLGNTGFIPASTMKLVTGLISLETLGPDYRFKTDFYLDKANN